MNYPYFGQTGQGATSVPPSTQPANVQQVTPQQNPQFLMNNQQFHGNQMNQPLFPHPRGVYLITMNGHITCSIDGIIYDTFNPKDRLVWGAYRVI